MIQDPISEENKHIEEYLDDYFERPDTEYAVMINGPWGTGKTWFIKKIIDKYHSKERKKIYISLNGMAKTDAIDSELFRVMHPILGHKKTKFLSKLIANVIKTTIKVNFIGDDEKETLNLSIPTLDISDLVEPGKETTIIFDDLERCQIPIKEVLGYINYFVEHQNLKIVIIADEEKIKIKENDNYLNNKEKLIATTFLLEGSYKTAINAFLEEKSLSKIKDKLIKNKEAIYDVYNKSGFKNLRSMKQALQEFSLFYDENYFNGKKGDELFIKILKFFLIFSLEVRAGVFQNKIFEFKEDIDKEGKEETPIKPLQLPKKRVEFFDKYLIPEHEYYIFDIDTWTDIVIYNKIDKIKINNHLFKNYYNLLSEEPDWFKLWDFENLNQNQFEECIENIFKNLINKTYTEIGEIKHIAGLLWYFNKNGLINNYNSLELESLILENVDAIVENNVNFQKYLDEKKPMMDTSWVSYSFYELESDFVQDIFRKIKEMCSNQKKKNCRKEAPSIFNLLKNKELDNFSKNLTIQHNLKGRFWNDPILNEINIEDFTLVILELDKTQLLSLFSTFYMRYEMSKSVYDVEREWLLNIIEHLEKVVLPNSTGIIALKISDRILPNLKSIEKDLDFRYGLKRLSDDMSTL